MIAFSILPMLLPSILTLTHLLSTLASATILDLPQSSTLLPRFEGNCSDGALSFCSFPEFAFPPGFCCPSGTTCMAVNAFNVICCPTGERCTNLAPVTCDISLLDANNHPNNPVHSLNTTDPLDSCGDNKCCPRGYSCKSSACVADRSPISAGNSFNNPLASNPALTVTSSPTSTATLSTPSGPRSTNTASPALCSAVCNPSPSCVAYPTPALLAAFFPGLILGLLIGLLFALCLSRRRRSMISHPISSAAMAPQNQNICRTDFLRSDAMEKPRTLSLSTRLLRRGRSTRSEKSIFTGTDASIDGRAPLPPQLPLPMSQSYQTTTAMATLPHSTGDSRSSHNPSDGEEGGLPLKASRHKSAAPSDTTSMEFVLGELPNGGLGMGKGTTGSVGTGRTGSEVTSFAELMEGVGFRRGEPYLSGGGMGSRPQTAGRDGSTGDRGRSRMRTREV